MMTPLLDDYLALRRAAGFQLRIHEVHLRNFVKFATERGEAFVRAQSALDWSALAPSASQRGSRLDVVRLFARYAKLEDPRHEVPPVGVFSSRRPPYRPFIFTADQIQRVLHFAVALSPTGSLRPWTYCTLFSLLAVTGMRISEALALRLEDLTQDGLMIRKTKFQKSRILPLHPSTQAGLERYLHRRRHVGATDDHVFISLRGGALQYPTVVETFLQAVRAVGLHPGPGQRGPRLHDLRHSWAVKALEASPTATTKSPSMRSPCRPISVMQSWSAPMYTCTPPLGCSPTSLHAVNRPRGRSDDDFARYSCQRLPARTVTA